MFRKRHDATFHRLINSIFALLLMSAAVFAVAEPLPSQSSSQRSSYTDTTQSWRDISDPQELMRLGRERCLRNDYLAAADIYCRALALETRSAYAVLNHAAMYVADADSADMVAALGRFRECALGGLGADTAMIRDWLANQYGRHNLFDLEISVLTELDMPEASTGNRLANAAKTHFARRRYRYAASSGAAAYERIEEADRRSNAAFITYQSYSRLGIRDSALVWLRLSGSSNRDALFHAVALNQETGHLEEAAALIDSLPASLSKDTLRVRQYLFSGEIGKALDEVTASKSTAWVLNRNDRLLWRARCVIFGGRNVPDDAAPIIDSVNFVSSWHGASEILRYRYRLQTLEDANALDAWGRLEYLLYIGDLTGAARTFIGYKMTGEAGEAMAIRVARELAKSARYHEVLEVLEAVAKKDGSDKTHSPEYLYFTAEALSFTGRANEARVIVNKILKEFPNDIFAQKSRVLLMKI